jgi:ParB-like chromosome segregation protein Spo0J
MSKHGQPGVRQLRIGVDILFITTLKGVRQMSESKKTPDILNLATAAQTEIMYVPLNKFKLDDPQFRLRSDAEFDKPSLQPLMDSLALEGQQVPVEAFLDPQGHYIPIKGLRRLSSMRLQVAENHPGFKADMRVWTVVVKQASPQDLILRAVLDNETRKNFTQIERLEVAKKMEDLHVPVQRAAAALGIGVKTYERDRLLLLNPWILDLVKEDCIVASNAVLLLEAAKSVNRNAELKEDLLGWVTETKQKLEERGRLHKKEGSKLRPVEALVRKEMTRDLVVEWVKQLRQGERFAQAVPWDFGADINPDSDQLEIERIKVNLAKAPLDQLAKVASRLARVQKGVMSYLKTRHELEAPEGPQDIVRQGANTPYDLDILRQAGMDDLADRLDQDLRAGDLDGPGTE